MTQPAKSYPNEALTAVCELLEELEVTSPDHIKNLAADLLGEMENREQSRNEAAWEAWNDPEAIAARKHAHDDALRDAGRGHLVKP